MALALSAVFLVIASGGVANASAPAHLGGKITNLPAKTPGGRAVQVVAIHFPEGRIADADRADDRGRYALEVPAGVNALLTQVIPVGGARSTSVLSAVIKVKPGERRKLKLRAKKRKRRHGHGHGNGHHGRESAKPAPGGRVIAEDGKVYPGESFAFRQFTGATGGWRFANGGLPDMFTTDLLDRLGAPESCEYTLVERRRMDTILQEIELGQSGLVDPDTAVKPGHLIPVELWIEGTLSNEFDAPAPLRYEIRIVEAATGTVRTTLRGLLSGDAAFFDDQRALAQRVVQAICAGPTVCPLRGLVQTSDSGPSGATARRASCGTDDPPPPVGAPRYSGPISGHYTALAGPSAIEIDWSGSVEFALTGELSSPPFGSDLPPPGPYAYYETTAGSVHVTFSYDDFPNCTWSGETDIAITPGAPYGTLYGQEGVAQPAYSLAVQAGASDTVPFTKSGTDPSCTGTGIWPLYGIAFALTPTYQTSPSSTLVGSATFSPGPGQTETTNWNLTPSG